jgi:phage terminase large subunit-like protein
VWLILAGRGFGKTRTGAQWIISRARQGYRHIGLIGQTAADVRDVMVKGRAGVLTSAPPWFRPKYYPSNRLLVFPNGAECHTYSGDEPDQLRGPEHDTVWADEPAKWKYARDAWDNMEMGLRVGMNPRCCATTTPRPIPIIRELLAEEKEGSVTVTRGSTFENAANLAPSAIARLKRKYEGTRLGRQELYAEVLDENPAALWKRRQIEELRVLEAPEMQRIVVAIDPSVSDGEEAAECGIVGAGLGRDNHGYTLEDKSMRGSPLEWARAAVTLFKKLKADRIIAEANQGGKMVETTLRTVSLNVPVTLVHASRGKATRAEPVSALYEQGRCHHVGTFPELEDQMVEWVPGEMSPDRLDALVWAYTDLFKLGEEPENPLEGMVVTVGVKGWQPR